MERFENIILPLNINPVDYFVLAKRENQLRGFQLFGKKYQLDPAAVQ